MKMYNNNASSNSIFTLRNCILAGVLLQNAGYTLLRKYSTMKEKVSSKEILLVSELIKITFAIYFTLTSNERSDAQAYSGINRLKWLLSNSYKMFVLALIYSVMNILSFIALTYIGAGEFTICAQLKILSTAAFSVFVLGTSLSTLKLISLFTLVVGCILVASPNFEKKQVLDDAGDNTFVNRILLGYGSVLTEVILSGFASIYFEKVVKSTNEGKFINYVYI